jgi:mitogen-activated protein kinase kinase kinase
MRDHGLPPFVNSLADLGFVLVRTRGSSSVYAFASTLVDDRRDAILRILTSDFTGFNDLAHGGYEGDDVPPYLLIVGSGTEFSWKGSVIEEDLEVPFTVKNDRIRLIADGTERTLRVAKRHFLNEVIGSHKVTCIKEAMSGIKSVQRALRRVFAARVTLADAFIQSTNRAWMQFRATFTSHVFLQEILSEAAEYALTTTRKSTREGVLITQSLLADATLSWLTFISEDCDSDDRHTFAWAVKALEFVKEHVIASPLIPTQFEDLRRAVGGCMSLLIGHYNVPMLRSEEQERQDAALLDATDSSTRGRRRRKPDKAAGRNESQTITAREQAVLQAIQEIETSREERLREMRLAGVVLEDQSRETAMLAAASSNLTIRWKRGRFIGSGASGSVHLAVDLDSGAVMAVKEIDFHRASAQAIKDVQLLFKQELDVMEMLQHSNIVTYHGIEVHREKVYIFQGMLVLPPTASFTPVDAMIEYCSGGSLEEVLEMGRIEDDIIVQIYTLQVGLFPW